MSSSNTVSPDSTLQSTKRSTTRTHKERGSHRRQEIYDILDSGLVCHAGFAIDGSPFVIPTAYCRLEDRVILHGSVASRMMRELGEGLETCVTVTLLDGLVLAGSQFNHSMNYRSVMIFGRARPILDPEGKKRALAALVEHLVPGRGPDSRPPNDKELTATAVLELPIEEASAKVRSGPPKDQPADLELGFWTGVVPMRPVYGTPQPAPDLASGIAVPDYLNGLNSGVSEQP